MRAPNFSLPDQDGKLHTLDQYKGKWLVIYFYPKDNTPGCIREACGFRDHIGQLQKQGIQVLGISKDSVVSHKGFAEKYQLPFPLLSDESAATIKAYGAWGIKQILGRGFEGILRKTYIIDPEGEIRKEYEKVEVKDHAETVLNKIQELMGS